MQMKVLAYLSPGVFKLPCPLADLGLPRLSTSFFFENASNAIIDGGNFVIVNHNNSHVDPSESHIIHISCEHCFVSALLILSKSL